MATILASKWDPHKETIRRLYRDDKISLDDLVRIMNEKYHFTASKRVFERQLKQWGFHKNKSSKHIKFLKIRLDHRQKVKKETHILLDGLLVPKLEIEKKVKQCHVTMVERYQLERENTPEGLILLTPTSDNYMNYVKSRDLPWISFLGKLPPIKSLTMWIDMPPQVLSVILPALCPQLPIPVGTIEQSIRHLSAVLPVRRDQAVYSLLHQVVSSNYAVATVRVLELALYAISNRLCRLQAEDNRYHEEHVCDELLKWFQMGDNYRVLGKILSYKSPTIEAVAGSIFAAALEAQDRHIVSIFLTSGMSPNIYIETQESSPLHIAARVRNLGIVDLLLKHEAKVDPLRSSNDLTPITIAASNNDIEIVQLLVLNGASVNICSNAISPLQMAALGGHLEIVQLLLNFGADINSYTQEEQFYREGEMPNGSPVECAIRSRTGSLVDLLLECGADLECRPSTAANTPLQSAAMFDDTELVLRLLQMGANIKASAPGCRGFRGRTALQWAAGNGNFQLCQDLLEAGAEPDSLVEAVESKIYKVVELLLQHGANVNDRRGHMTALETAIQVNEIAIAQLLLSAQADPRLGDALALAVEKQNIELVSTLLAAGIDSNAISEGLRKAVLARNCELVELLLGAARLADDGHDLLMSEFLVHHLVHAVQDENLQIINVLLSAGANCNALGSKNHVDNQGSNAFQAAAATGNMQLVLHLLEAGAELNHPTGPSSGRTALQAAVKSRNIELVDFFIEKGADVNSPAAAYNGITALQAATDGYADEKPAVDLVRRLLAAGANPNDHAAKDGIGDQYSSLQQAASTGADDIICLLLDYGANINAATNIGKYTALQAAALWGHFQTVRLLLERGADVNTPSVGEAGRSALQAAACQGFLHIADLLLKAGANVNQDNHTWRRGSPRTALVEAAMMGRIDIMKLLLNAGADTTSEFGRSQLKEAMMWATRNGHDAAVKFLKYHQLC